MNSFKILLYFWESSFTIFESSQTGPLLCKIANNMPPCATRKTILSFAKDAGSNRVTFTAGGLFTIDRALFFAAFASCATNITILMQSHISTSK